MDGQAERVRTNGLRKIGSNALLHRGRRATTVSGDSSTRTLSSGIEDIHALRCKNYTIACRECLIFYHICRTQQHRAVRASPIFLDNCHLSLEPFSFNPNPLIARSTPLQPRKTFCNPAGKTSIHPIHLAYAGTASTPPSPLSIIATSLTANSLTSTTGAKNLATRPRHTPANNPVFSWPGVTSMVLMFGLAASSAEREEWKASSAALEAV